VLAIEPRAWWLGIQDLAILQQPSAGQPPLGATAL
jgi:hypothetical protein